MTAELYNFMKLNKAPSHTKHKRLGEILIEVRNHYTGESDQVNRHAFQNDSTLTVSNDTFIFSSCFWELAFCKIPNLHHEFTILCDTGLLGEKKQKLGTKVC